MTDSELRALCHRFLDAIERQDFETVADVYHPELRFWVNLTGKELSRDESLSVLREGAGRHRRVITSYSIHYTKLYESCGERLA